MKIIRNKAKWLAYARKCVEYYNVLNENIYDEPIQYPCISVPHLISDINGQRIKFSFVYKKDCEVLLNGE